MALEGISRRTFVEGATVAAAFAGTMASVQALDQALAEEATETLSCDVAVVGLGAAGLMAALAAADEGAQVIAIDSADDFEGTTNTHTTGAWMIESKEQLKYDHYLTQQQAFEWVEPGTHYQCNGKVLRNIIRSSTQAANYLIAGGVQFLYAFAGTTEEDTMLNRGGHVYLEEGAPRADNFRAMCADRETLTTMFGYKGVELVRNDGAPCAALLPRDPTAPCASRQSLSS